MQSTMQQKMNREISKLRIEEIEKILKNAEVVVEDEVDRRQDQRWLQSKSSGYGI